MAHIKPCEQIISSGSKRISVFITARAWPDLKKWARAPDPNLTPIQVSSVRDISAYLCSTIFSLWPLSGWTGSVLFWSGMQLTTHSYNTSGLDLGISSRVVSSLLAIYTTWTNYLISSNSENKTFQIHVTSSILTVFYLALPSVVIKSRNLQWLGSIFMPWIGRS